MTSNTKSTKLITRAAVILLAFAVVFTTHAAGKAHYFSGGMIGGF